MQLDRYQYEYLLRYSWYGVMKTNYEMLAAKEVDIFTIEIISWALCVCVQFGFMFNPVTDSSSRSAGKSVKSCEKLPLEGAAICQQAASVHTSNPFLGHPLQQ